MILVFGGTTEGKIAAQTLDTAGSVFFYSIRGNGSVPELHNGIILQGGMEEEQMLNFCKDNDIRLIIDAAHPFASLLRKNIAAVACKLALPVIRYERIFESRRTSVIWCKDFLDAVDKLMKDNIHVLLALTGVKTISKLKPYWSSDNIQCFFRILDREDSVSVALNAGYPKDKLLFFNTNYGNCSSEEIVKEEEEFMKKINPQAIITKESGVSGYFNEKVTAATNLGIKVYSVMRPDVPKEFIKVYGGVGVRMEVERLIDGFFPLRIGLTTGTCATAATKTALGVLIAREFLNSCNPADESYRTKYCCNNGEIVRESVILPSGEPVEVDVKIIDTGLCSVKKYSGDDPDVTDGCEVVSRVVLNNTGEYLFHKGDGVGMVTLPGLGLKMGGPAINTSPRKMMERECRKLLQRSAVLESSLPNRGVDITISVPNGEEIAKKTFNPKVGVTGGISIIGTSGVVKPFSKEAFVNSMRKEMDVAFAMGLKHLVINSGAKSEDQLKSFLRLKYPDTYQTIFLPQSFVHYGNFIGDAVSLASQVGFSELTLGIMIGKAVKLAAGNLNTHSKNVLIDKDFIKRMAKESGCATIPENFSLARELWDIFDNRDSQRFFPYLLHKCRCYCSPLFGDKKINLVLIPELSGPDTEFFYC